MVENDQIVLSILKREKLIGGNKNKGKKFFVEIQQKIRTLKIKIE